MLKCVRGKGLDNTRSEGMSRMKLVNATVMKSANEVVLNEDVLVDARANQKTDNAGQDCLEKSLLRVAVVNV